MKKIIQLTLASLIMILACSITQAQENIAKIGLFGLTAKTINLKYERILNENSSANLNLSFQISGGLPLGLNIQNYVDNEIIGTVRLSGFSIAPEYRIYTKGEAPRGFYFAPYLQYKNAGLDYAGQVQNYPTDSKFNYSNIGVGFQLGAQWLIQDKVSIDWTFLGIGLGRHWLRVRYESDDPAIDFQNIIDDIKMEIDGIPIVGDRLDFEAGADYAEGNARFIFPLLRGGLTIGYAF